MKCAGSWAGVTEAMAWARSCWPSGGESVGWQKEGERLGAVILHREMTPGGEYSGCPGSMSRTITLDQGWFLEAPRSVMRRLVNSLPKVDFPDDLGPQRKITGVPFRFAAARPDSFLFHSAGDASSCSVALFGTSLEV